MKKLLIFSLILLFVLPIVYAETFKQGESKVISGKTITVTSIGENKIVVDVDRIGAILKLNDQKEINGAVIKVNEVHDVEPKTAVLTITIKYICGDNKCDSGETKETCCKDCGCSEGLSCFENICINLKDNECEAPENCDDKNPSTADICSGVPRKCSHKELKCSKDEDCEDNNKNTANICMTNVSLCTFISYDVLAECKTDTDCNDKISCTTDKCQGLPKKCVHEQITSCSSHDDCCPPGCFYPDDLNCGEEKSDPNISKQFDQLNINKNLTENKTEIKEVKVNIFKKVISFFKKLFTKA